ncbi:MAG: hypothetical protein HC852_10545 [Acaryochloridaceae cyanobacterium RU_4_10]|nr:hypothetical protein [Acaryochloridaceae cyanobacterium RU_4_10]
MENLIKTKVKDHHFHASIRFAGCLFGFPLYYLLLLAILCLIGGWGFGVTAILAIGLISWLGILSYDKLRILEKRKILAVE